MGAKQSKTSLQQSDEMKLNPIQQMGKSLKTKVQDEVNQRMMVQREVQMAINIAKARDQIQIFGSAWALLTSGVALAKLRGKPVPPVAAVPVLAGGLLLGNMADLAYGNKLSRVAKEAEHIIENERVRLAPLKQGPMANYYTREEKAIMLDEATPSGMLWPSSLFSRSFVPASTVSEPLEPGRREKD